MNCMDTVILYMAISLRFRWSTLFALQKKSKVRCSELVGEEQHGHQVSGNYMRTYTISHKNSAVSTLLYT